MTENEQLEMVGIITRIKAEAIKEFAERLKEKLIERSIVYVTIDDLLKEMVGEEK